MKKGATLLVLMSMYIIAFGQTWKGKVLDEVTHTQLAFANIGIVGKDIGTVSDESGSFELTIVPSKNMGDTLRFSAIGYCNTDLVITQEMNFSDHVFLSPCAALLPEVEVVATNFKKEKTLGHTATSKKIVFYFMSNKLGTELATKIEVKKGPVSVVNAHFNIAENRFGEVLFRVNIYDFDPKTQLPGKKILSEELIAKTSKNSETLTVDLRPYNIIVERDFVLSLEWIKALNGGKITEDLKFCAALTTKENVFIKKASQSAWKAFDDKKMGLNAGVAFYVDVKY